MRNGEFKQLHFHFLRFRRANHRAGISGKPSLTGMQIRSQIRDAVMPHQILCRADRASGAADVDCCRDLIRRNTFYFRAELDDCVRIEENGFFRFHAVDVLRADSCREVSVGDSADELRCSKPACGEPE